MEKKKKVAILLPWLKMGGTNMVALRFMKELVQYCDVTLTLSQNIGELLSEIPEGVHLIIDQMNDFKKIFFADCKHLRLRYLLKDFIYYFRIRTGRDSIDNYLYLVKRHSYITDEEYDCAITYHGQSPERLLNLIYRIHAEKKVAWIHGEMSFSEDDCKRMEKYYAQMNHFFFVSNHTKKSFQKAIHLPKLNADVYYNPIDASEIIRKSMEPMEVPFDYDYFNIVTVGRVSAEKGQDMIPEIMQRLLQSGKKIRWYVIGDGPEFEKLKAAVSEKAVQKSVILLGVKNNPYPYMKDADLYVQPSYTEGYSTTICEAGILGQAMVGTKPSGGIYDQITHRKDGFIVDATVEGLFSGISELMNNETLRCTFKKQILHKNFEGKGEINKFLDYLYE